MYRKSFWVLLLSFMMVLSLATASFAAPGKGNKDSKKEGQSKKAAQLVDIKNHWAEQSIEAIYKKGIILGYPDFTFKPNAPVSKYEAIMMICRASGYSGSASGDSLFREDGNVPEWMRDCLNYAVDRNILTENEASNIKGWQPAKRYEVAVWAVRAMRLDLDSSVSFGDLNEAPVYSLSYVGGMYKGRYMVGYPGNKFQPNKPVTRAEMAAIIYRILLEKGNSSDGGSNNGGSTSIYGAEIIEHNIPETMTPGSSYEVSIKVKNTGSEAWTADKEFRLEAVGDSDPFGPKRVNLTSSDYIEKNQSKTFNFTMKAPAKAGTYTTGWRMVREGNRWFGETLTVRVKVSNFGLVELTPRNGATNVSTSTKLRAVFSENIKLVGDSLMEAVTIRNKSKGHAVDVDIVEIVAGNTLLITPESLERGYRYEVTIKADYFEGKESGEFFKGIDGADWSFRTRSN